jgi:hypothetical protein
MHAKQRECPVNGDAELRWTGVVAQEVQRYWDLCQGHVTGIGADIEGAIVACTPEEPM